MTPLVGLALGGAVLRPRPRASIGAPAWGPPALLADLELRLGLPSNVVPESVRIPRWAARIASLGDESAFYRRSFAVDPLGTTNALLAWRDELVAAGWEGQPVAGGGERLAAMAAIEAHGPAEPPSSDADRLARVDSALADMNLRIYDAITFVEERELWPRRWQNVFARLAARGTTLSRVAVELSGATPTTDLGRLQASFRGSCVEAPVRGDGTLLLVRGDTPADLAELAGSLLAHGRDAGKKDAVVRSLDPWPLDAALERQGLARQGVASESRWRPAMQLLPLAVELAFEPRDPLRVLELLTLATGPIRSDLARRLARAVTRQPGIGGKEWQRQRADGSERLLARRFEAERASGAEEDEARRRAEVVLSEQLRRTEAWLETPGAGPEGATRSALLVVTARVAELTASGVKRGEVDVYAPAHAQVRAFADALEHDPREVFTLEEARQLVDHFARPEVNLAASLEESGRVDHVVHPSAILAERDRIIFWNFVSGVERRPARLPWNDVERAALADVGVTFPDTTSLLRAEADAWRSAVLAACERVVFVVPRSIKATATAPHSLWDEVRARLRLDDEGVVRITREARQVLAGEATVPGVRVTSSPALALPEPRGAWTVPAVDLRVPAQAPATSVTSLERIAACPLAWVFEQRAGLRSGAMSTVSAGPLLNGALGHRLVEELFAEGAFDLDEPAFLVRVDACFDRLLASEGATLLLPGASIERLQLTRQLRSGMRNLRRYLGRAGYRIAGVEETIETTSAVGDLQGRLDLRLTDEAGHTAILDLKWGVNTYRTLLREGRAVQLAAYARGIASRGEPAPPVGYFALSSGSALSADPRMTPDEHVAGPSTEETWRRIEATAAAVVESHERGTIYVSATKRALPLLDALAVAKDRRHMFLDPAPGSACTHCSYSAICGLKWEALG